MTNARRAIGAHGWGMGLSILLLVAAMAAYRYAAPLAGSTAVVGTSRAAPQYLLGGHGELVAGASTAQAALRITAASPALNGDGSAYDGRAYQPQPAAVSSVLGIDLPAGATRAGLPSGLTDYLRPAHAAPRTPAPAVSSVLGITLPYGANAYDLPAGITDYLRSDR